MIGFRGNRGPYAFVDEGDPNPDRLARVEQWIDAANLDHLILEYTPLAFAYKGRRSNIHISQMVRNLRARVRISIFVHETYFQHWRSPKSLLYGALDKHLLQDLCRMAHRVFSASEPLIEEMCAWGLAEAPVHLPIFSNIPKQPANTAKLKANYGLTKDASVLTLFGGGNNLKWQLGNVHALTRALNARSLCHAWLALGGVPRNWLPRSATVIDPGHLPVTELSAHMQMTDIFLMPNWSGVCLKRGTLIAAMEHALPVVGTHGYMTDDLMRHMTGVKLFTARDVNGFSQAVIDLIQDENLRSRFGQLNQNFAIEHFSASMVARKVMKALETV